MKQKHWIVPAGAALGLLCAGTALWAGKSGSGWTALSRPIQALGEGLRGLALSGFGGNLAAWAAVLLLSALPLLLWLVLGKEKRGTEDWLLGLTVPVLFWGLYFLINPTLLAWPAREVFPVAAAGTLLSMGVAWLALKLLRRLEGSSRERQARAFEGLLLVCAALTAFAAVWGQMMEGAQRWKTAVEGNTAPVDLTLVTLVVLGVLYAAPGILSALTMVWGAALARVLGREDFGAEGVELCERTALGCRMVAQATLVLAVSANLLQLALLEQLTSTYFSLTLPLMSLMLSVGLMLLCRCLQRGRELQEDSDSII